MVLSVIAEEVTEKGEGGGNFSFVLNYSVFLYSLFLLEV